VVIFEGEAGGLKSNRVKVKITGQTRAEALREFQALLAKLNHVKAAADGLSVTLAGVASGLLDYFIERFALLANPSISFGALFDVAVGLFVWDELGDRATVARQTLMGLNTLNLENLPHGKP